ncbi:ead/Ea22-like family protein [Escherichia coli]|nr:ead/Ea22-like family protein [Escherichia coli]
MSNIDKQALRERYSPQPIPKCHICGAEMTVQRMSASRITYGCTGATYDDNGCHYVEGRSIADDHYEQSRITVVDVSDPDVLALLDELEAADNTVAQLNNEICNLLPGVQYMDPPDGGSVTPIEQVRRMVVDYREQMEAAEKRIAELEARDIQPVKGEVLVTVSGFTGCGKSAIAGEIEIAMRAIGVPVTWTNGDAEKRMTGADWLTAIEMYKPSVQIVEVNVPRAAGIGKGE